MALDSTDDIIVVVASTVSVEGPVTKGDFPLFRIPGKPRLSGSRRRLVAFGKRRGSE